MKYGFFDLFSLFVFAVLFSTIFLVAANPALCSEGEDEFDQFNFVSVLIDGKYYDIYYRKVTRSNLGEKDAYDLKDAFLFIEEIDYYVTGYRKYDAGTHEWHWEIETNSVPSEDAVLPGESILVDIARRERGEAREIFSDIFQQVYQATVSDNER